MPVPRIHIPIHRHVHHGVRILFWFLTGAALGLFFFVSFLYIFYQQHYHATVYPGVFINGIDLGGKSQEQVRHYFSTQNNRLAHTEVVFRYQEAIASASAQQLQLGYDADLLSLQAISVGRSGDVLSNASILLQAYMYGVHLSPAYHVNDQVLTTTLSPLASLINSDPVNASFTFSGARVTAFRLSVDGKHLDIDQTKTMLINKTAGFLLLPPFRQIAIALPVKIIPPSITTTSVNQYGIKEMIGSGTSLFAGSIPNRVFNVGLAASRINGTLVAPNEVFSFDKTVGDISGLSGYKQAYVIQNGHTVLGDGGGVCQVSTTLFRALLNAGVPIVERHPHAYEVHYYTEDAPLGFDASIYSPSFDLKFKNDTGHYILIESVMDAQNQQLTFNLYGTSDNREVTISSPVISDQSPAPEALYQDDPNSPKGTIQQIDFSAPGAKSVFTRTVTRDGKTLIADTFVSEYRPWQAVYVRGTK